MVRSSLYCKRCCLPATTLTRYNMRDGPTKMVSKTATHSSARLLLLRWTCGHFRPYPAPLPVAKKTAEHRPCDDHTGLLSVQR